MIKLSKTTAILVISCLASILTVNALLAADPKIVATKLLIDGHGINIAAGTPIALEHLLLNKFNDITTGTTHKQRVEAIRPTGNGAWNGSIYFNGLGGIAALPALDIAEDTLDPTTGAGATENHDRKPGAWVYGAIEEFHFNLDKSGSMKVIQIYTTALGRSGNSRLAAYRYHINVAANGFNVDTKNLSNPNNVFPATAAATGIEINAETAEGFNYKLYARGTDITVTGIDEVHGYHGHGNLNWSAINLGLPATKKIWDAITTPNADSCLDMMFSEYPPSTLPDGAEPPFYCLGRCKASTGPMLINTR